MCFRACESTWQRPHRWVSCTIRVSVYNNHRMSTGVNLSASSASWIFRRAGRSVLTNLKLFCAMSISLRCVHGWTCRFDLLTLNVSLHLYIIDFSLYILFTSSHYCICFLIFWFSVTQRVPLHLHPLYLYCINSSRTHFSYFCVTYCKHTHTHNISSFCKHSGAAARIIWS